MDNILAAKTIVITGGTSALGRVFVRQALKAGARVFATYHQNHDEAQRLQAEGAEMSSVDLNDASTIDAFSKKIREKANALDALIHNAADTRDKTLQNLSEDDWDDVIRINLKAPFLLTKKLLPLLMRRIPKQASESEKAAIPPSKIFMIVSRLAVTGGIGVSNYAAAKAGLLGLAKSLAKELGSRKVLVNAVNPGFMISKMTRDLPETVKEKNRELSATGSFSDPEEVASFLVYLCSDAMKQATGQVFHFESRPL